MEKPEFLSMDEAAAELHLNRATVFRWVRHLGLETRRFFGSKKTYLAASDVERIREVHAKPWLAGEKPEEAVA